MAKTKAEEFLNEKGKGYTLLVKEPGVSFEYGWIFQYDHEGVFHPRVDQITEKMKVFVQQGLSEEDCFERFSKEEIEIYENSIGLVGNAPVYVDRENGMVKYCYDFPLELAVQKIREEKTGSKYQWEFYLKIKPSLSVLKMLKEGLQFSNKEITALKDSIGKGSPILTSSSFSKILYYKKIIESNKIDFEIKEEIIETLPNRV